MQSRLARMVSAGWLLTIFMVLGLLYVHPESVGLQLVAIAEALAAPVVLLVQLVFAGPGVGTSGELGLRRRHLGRQDVR